MPDSPKEFLDEFHYHEALDRLHVIMSNIDTHIIQHPTFKLNKDFSRKVESALSHLWEAYQIIGSISHERSKQ